MLSNWDCFESIRHQVQLELKQHDAQNSAMQRTRYPVITKFLKWAFAWPTFEKYILLYIGALLIATACEIANDLYCRNNWCPFEYPSAMLYSLPKKDFITTLSGFFISAQAGAVTVISMALAIVTLIGQKNSAKQDVRIYYHESLSLPLAASSVSLLLILCIQAAWPLQFLTHQFGIALDALAIQISFTALHAFWLAVNIAGVAHFLFVSLAFVEDGYRKKSREQYSAQFVVRNDLRLTLLKARYSNIHAYLTINYPRIDIDFADSISTPPIIELQRDFKDIQRLYDIWVAPLRLALSLWAKRNSIVIANLPNEQVKLYFPIRFEKDYTGLTTLCWRHGGIKLNYFERALVNISFRYKRWVS